MNVSLKALDNLERLDTLQAKAVDPVKIAGLLRSGNARLNDAKAPF